MFFCGVYNSFCFGFFQNSLNKFLKSSKNIVKFYFVMIRLKRNLKKRTASGLRLDPMCVWQHLHLLLNRHNYFLVLVCYSFLKISINSIHWVLQQWLFSACLKTWSIIWKCYFLNALFIQSSISTITWKYRTI